MSVEIGSPLTSSPEIRDGRPCVAGTRTTAHRIAVWYKMGESPEEIAQQHKHLPLAGVYAVLAYYHANQAQVEAEIAADQAAEEQIEADYLQQQQRERVA
ncbi:MAG: DUF433 domain-containing protein [Acidobacteriota bacterium]|nr:DUF433 domain-containing protein [Acidobacteriota bacterium]